MELCDEAAGALLRTAAAKGDLDEMRSCLGKGANIDEVGTIAFRRFRAAAALRAADRAAAARARASPLHFACLFGRLEAVELLLTLRANTTIVDNCGNTALELARMFQHNEIVTLLEIQQLEGEAEYPFWVCTRDGFLRLSGILPPHEQAIIDEVGLMMRLTYQFMTTMLSVILFVSHRWLSLDHPDPDGIKLRHLQALLRLPQFQCVQFVWIDYCCISQSQGREEMKQRAINSLAFYARNCAHFLALHGESEGCLWEEYEKRGWCRLEMQAATSSKATVMWISNFHRNIADKYVMVPFPDGYAVENPLQGVFRGEDEEQENERKRIAPMVHRLCQITTLLPGEEKPFLKYKAQEMLNYIQRKQYLG